MTCVCVFQVLGHRRRQSQPMNLPVSDSMFVRDNSTFAKDFRDRFSTLKTEFDEVCSLCVYNSPYFYVFATYFCSTRHFHLAFYWYESDRWPMSESNLKWLEGAATDFRNFMKGCGHVKMWGRVLQTTDNIMSWRRDGWASHLFIGEKNYEAGFQRRPSRFQ